MGGARNLDPGCRSFISVRVLALCCIGVGAWNGPVFLGMKPPEVVAFVEYPLSHAAIACFGCRGSYWVGFGAFSFLLLFWRVYRSGNSLRVFQSRC